MNLITLATAVNDNRTAITFLQSRGIILEQKQCQNNHLMSLECKDTGNRSRERWRCSLRACREEVSVRKGTWLEGSRLPIQKIVWFIYCWSKDYVSISFCENELDINKHTAVDFSNYMREVCAASLLRDSCVIGGPNTVVEIDESQFPKRKNNVGRVLPPQWVFGGVCRNTGESFLVAVEDRSMETLLPIIKQYIRPGTTICSESDKWKDERLDREGYTHLVVNHSENFLDPQTGAHTQTVESCWRLAKMKMKSQCGTHRTLLDSYLCEYMWRRRHKNDDLFETILSDISLFMPPVADYWKSQPRKFCEFCKCWLTDNKPSIEFHEKGKQHQENVRKKIEKDKTETDVIVKLEPEEKDDNSEVDAVFEGPLPRDADTDNRTRAETCTSRKAYGEWVTHEEEAPVDYELPEVPTKDIPRQDFYEEEPVKFKEKHVTSLSHSEDVTAVAFKKCKVTKGARNMHSRDDSDD